MSKSLLLVASLKLEIAKSLSRSSGDSTAPVPAPVLQFSNAADIISHLMTMIAKVLSGRMEPAASQPAISLTPQGRSESAASQPDSALTPSASLGRTEPAASQPDTSITSPALERTKRAASEPDTSLRGTTPASGRTERATSQPAISLTPQGRSESAASQPDSALTPSASLGKMEPAVSQPDISLTPPEGNSTPVQWAHSLTVPWPKQTTEHTSPPPPLENIQRRKEMDPTECSSTVDVLPISSSKKCNNCGGEGFLACFTCKGSTAQDWKEGQCECYCEECSSMVHMTDMGTSTGHEILPTVVHVSLGSKVVVCTKLAACQVQPLKRLINTSATDRVKITPTQALREDPFVLGHVLGFMEMPKKFMWCPPCDPKVVMGIIRVAQEWDIQLLLQRLAWVLEIDVEGFSRPGKKLRVLVRDKLRISKFRESKTEEVCILCGGGWRRPPLQVKTSVLDCCHHRVHFHCEMEAILNCEKCPGCGADIQRNAIDERPRPRFIGPRVPPAPPRPLINWAEIPPLPEEIANFRKLEKETVFKDAIWRPG